VSRVKAVIFDWAGTIVDFGSRAPALAFVELFRRHQVNITVPEARGPMGTAKKDHIRALIQHGGIADRWQEAHGRAATETDVDELYAEFIPLQLSVLGDHADVVPGVIETIAALRARGIKVGSTTGYNREMGELVQRKAAEQGLTVDTMVTASDVDAGRPSPWMALEAARRLGVYPLAGIVKIGDTVADIHEGLNAGMWSVGVVTTGNELGLSLPELLAMGMAERDEAAMAASRRLRAAGAHEILDSAANCLPLLADIEARLAKGERP
jgi:phosphonoacetaldehyde hydrolase